MRILSWNIKDWASSREQSVIQVLKSIIQDSNTDTPAYIAIQENSDCSTAGEFISAQNHAPYIQGIPFFNNTYKVHTESPSNAPAQKRMCILYSTKDPCIHEGFDQKAKIRWIQFTHQSHPDIYFIHCEGGELVETGRTVEIKRVLESFSRRPEGQIGDRPFVAIGDWNNGPDYLCNSKSTAYKEILNNYTHSKTLPPNQRAHRQLNLNPNQKIVLTNTIIDNGTPSRRHGGWYRMNDKKKKWFTTNNTLFPEFTRFDYESLDQRQSPNPGHKIAGWNDFFASNLKSDEYETTLVHYMFDRSLAFTSSFTPDGHLPSDHIPIEIGITQSIKDCNANQSI